MPPSHCRTWRRWCTCAAALVAAHAALGAGANVAAAADEGAPGAGGAEAEARALVKQLGDADFKAREAAAARLKELGRDALPALTEALAAASDPEVCSRADALMRRIQRPPVPREWLEDANVAGGFDRGFGAGGFSVRGFGGTQVRTSVVNGTRVVDVNGGAGRRVSITEGPNGIDMTVTGADEDGELVTSRFRARNADELRDSDPDAFAIYQRWAGNGRGLGAGAMRGRRLVIPEARGLVRPPMQLPAPLPMPQPRIERQFELRGGIIGPAPLLRPPADDLTNLAEKLARQMRETAVADDQQRAVRELLKGLEAIQAQGRAAAPADLDKQVQQYNALSDALRQKLSDLKLPDPGDALPPPASARLGISVQASAAELLGMPGAAEPPRDGIVVSRVLPDSRAAKMGMAEGDSIRTVNGEGVANIAALRRAVTEAKGPLVIEVTRGRRPVTLRENVR